MHFIVITSLVYILLLKCRI